MSIYLLLIKEIDTGTFITERLNLIMDKILKAVAGSKGNKRGNKEIKFCAMRMTTSYQHSGQEFKQDHFTQKTKTLVDSTEHTRRKIEPALNI